MTDSQREALIQTAQAARSNAYAPYSVYRVGAAVLSSTGRVYPGCNVENASFGLTVCAERNAVARMVAEGEQELAAIALVTEPGAPPCGACLQVLAEFASGKDMSVLLVDGQGRIEETNLGALFPRAFEEPGLKRG
jgi:cytidine deaminase